MSQSEPPTSVPWTPTVSTDPDTPTSDQTDDSGGWSRAVGDRIVDAANWEDTELYQNWQRHVAQPPSNDFVIAITASSSTSVSRTGKTTQALQIAKSCDLSGGGFDAETKATLSEEELGYDIVPQAPPKSAVLYDEGQGTPGGTGLNKRRGMKSSTINAINAILANGDKQLTLVIVGQQLSMLDTMLYPIIDAWILIKQGPSGGPPTATYYSLEVDDFDLKNPKITTPAHEDLTWGPLPTDDPDYLELERMKQEAKQRDTEDSEEQATTTNIPKKARDKHIKERIEEGVDQDTLADAWGVTQPTISRIVNGKA